MVHCQSSVDIPSTYAHNRFLYYKMNNDINISYYIYYIMCVCVHLTERSY